MLVYMMELADAGHQFGFRWAIWLWTALARYCGYRRQEFAMGKKNEIQIYVKPNDKRVIRWLWVINDRALAKQTGQQYDIQKNRMNGQIVTQNRDREYPKLCPVELSIDIIVLARNLGAKNPDDPSYLFQREDGSTQFLMGDMITKYYRYVTKLVFPTISHDKLKLFLCHSASLKAVCLFSRGRKGWCLHRIENSMVEWLLSNVPTKYLHNLCTAYGRFRWRQCRYFAKIGAAKYQNPQRPSLQWWNRWNEYRARRLGLNIWLSKQST